jgi:hypothetical protein
MSYKEDIKEISEILDQLIELLKSVNRDEWAERLWRLRSDCEFAENEQDAARIRWLIRSIYGGMGSFTDLVLCKDSEILPEDESFSQLRTKLHATVINQLVKK